MWVKILGSVTPTSLGRACIYGILANLILVVICSLSKQVLPNVYLYSCGGICYQRHKKKFKKKKKMRERESPNHKSN